jgi:hypothetical protein
MDINLAGTVIAGGLIPVVARADNVSDFEILP